MELLPRLLLKNGFATRDQIEEAIRHQAVYGGHLGTNLVETGALREEELALCLSRQFGVPTVDVDRSAIDPELVERIGHERCRSAKVFPYRIESKTLALLMVNPGEHVVKAEIAYSTGLIVKPYVVTELTMAALLEQYCGMLPNWRHEESELDYIDRSSRAHRTKMETGGTLPRLPRAEPTVETAANRDEIVHSIVLQAARQIGRAVFFIVKKEIVFGWEGIGDRIDPDLVKAIAITLNRESIFDSVIKHPGHYLGSIPRSTANDLVRKALYKQRGNSLFVPVHVGGRVVNILYADAGPMATIDADIGPVLLAVQKLPAAYARVINSRLTRSFEEG